MRQCPPRPLAWLMSPLAMPSVLHRASCAVDPKSAAQDAKPRHRWRSAVESPHLFASFGRSRTQAVDSRADDSQGLRACARRVSRWPRPLVVADPGESWPVDQVWSYRSPRRRGGPGRRRGRCRSVRPGRRESRPRCGLAPCRASVPDAGNGLVGVPCVIPECAASFSRSRAQSVRTASLPRASRPLDRCAAPRPAPGRPGNSARAFAPRRLRCPRFPCRSTKFARSPVPFA